MNPAADTACEECGHRSHHLTERPADRSTHVDADENAELHGNTWSMNDAAVVAPSSLVGCSTNNSAGHHHPIL